MPPCDTYADACDTHTDSCDTYADSCDTYADACDTYRNTFPGSLHVGDQQNRDGTLSPTEGTHTAPEGALFQMSEPVADEGWFFAGWEGTNGDEVSDDGIIMTGNKAITAVFELIPTDEETPQAALRLWKRPGSTGTRIC
jgi:hypothetical protein